MTRVACIGEAMIEVSMSGASAQVGVAGDTLNTAIYLKRCAPELEVDYVTRLGTDPFSDQIAEFISGEEIGTDTVVRDPDGTPGLYAITVDEHGERTFTYWRSNSAARKLFSDGQFAALDSYDVIYLSGISLAILPQKIRLALLDYLKRSDAKLAFDSNYRPRLWESREVAAGVMGQYWARADYVLPSIDDEMALFAKPASSVMARCTSLPGVGALKRGSSGPLSIGASVSQTYASAPKVVDTTAAGDSFNGGYLAVLLTGGDQADALTAGHNMAVEVIQHKGAIIPR